MYLLEFVDISLVLYFREQNSDSFLNKDYKHKVFYAKKITYGTNFMLSILS